MARTNKPHDIWKMIDMSGGPEACWPFTGALNSEGRPYFTINGRKVLAYRETYEQYTGDKLGDRLLRHKCDNQICCNPKHGEPGDHQQNMDDMKERERHGLSHHMVRSIRKMLANGLTHQVIADFAGVDRTTITAIAGGKTHAHVKDE